MNSPLSAPTPKLIRTIVTILNREMTRVSASGASFRVDPEGTGIEFVLTADGASVTIPVPVREDSEEIHAWLPHGTVAVLRKKDFLDPAGYAWDN